MKNILLAAGTVAFAAFLTSCAATYHPPVDPQFSCDNIDTSKKVSIVGTDSLHVAHGYCREKMLTKNWDYSYDGKVYMKVKFRLNEEEKTSCLGDDGKWFSSTMAECRAKHNH